MTAFAVSAEPAKFDDAWEYFAARFPITDEIEEQLSEYAGSRAWKIAGVAQLDIVLDVYASLLNAIEKGTPFDEWKKNVEPALTKAWGKRDSHRVATIFRTNVQQANNAGRWRQIHDPDVLAFRPFGLFDGIADARQSPICKSCDGTILPLSDPWWDTHQPQLHHRCFPAGTPIATEHGTAPIESLRVGDRVWTHRARLRSVTDVHSGNEQLVELRLTSGRALTATGSHPALTQRGWVPVLDLLPGDCLIHATQVAIQSPRVGNSDRDQASLNKLPRASDWEALTALGNLNAYSEVIENEVDEDHTTGQHVSPLKRVEEAPVIQPFHKCTLSPSRRNARLAVPRGILAELLSSSRSGARDDVRAQKPAAFQEFARDRSQAGMSALGVPPGPVLPTGGPFASLSPETLGGDISSRGVTEPLMSDGLGATANPDAILLEQPRATGYIGEAEFATDLAQGHPAHLVEVSQDFWESLTMLLQESGFDCVLEVVARHSALDAPPAPIFNIAVDDDESYIANGFVVHNCRSRIRSLTEREAKRRGVTTRPTTTQADEGFGAPPDLTDWEPDPNRYPAQIWDEFQQKRKAAESKRK